MSTNRDQIIGWIALSICAAGFLSACATNPPPLPLGNPADPQVRAPARTPRNLLTRDETTLAIARELSQTGDTAKSSESMKHEGMQHGGMQGMQHEGTKMEEHSEAKQGGAMGSHEGMQHGAAAQPEKKAVADEMKKTADEMKTHATTYTCPMHPEVQSDKPDNCPKCGMKLVPKKETHEEH